MSKIVYTGWKYFVTLSTPIFGVYALYDIKEIFFNEERKQKYSESSQSKPVDFVPEVSSSKKEKQSSDEKHSAKMSSEDFKSRGEKIQQKKTVQTQRKVQFMRIISRGKQIMKKTVTRKNIGKAIKLVPIIIEYMKTHQKKITSELIAKNRKQTKTDSLRTKDKSSITDSSIKENKSTMTDSLITRNKSTMTDLLTLFATQIGFKKKNNSLLLKTATSQIRDLSLTKSPNCESGKKTDKQTKLAKLDDEESFIEFDNNVLLNKFPGLREYWLWSNQFETRFMTESVKMVDGETSTESVKMVDGETSTELAKMVDEETSIEFDKNVIFNKFQGLMDPWILSHQRERSIITESVKMVDGETSTEPVKMVDGETSTESVTMVDGETSTEDVKMEDTSIGTQEEQKNTRTFRTEITLILQNGEKRVTIGEGIPDNVNPQWTRDGCPVRPRREPSNRFHFAEICPADEGLYVCTFKQANAQLKVTYRVIVEGFQRLVFVRSGDRTEFGLTIADEDISATAKWKFDDSEIKSTPFQPTKFIIENFSKKDVGNYECTITFDSKKKTFKYCLIERGTEKTVFARKSEYAIFGKDIPVTDCLTKWTKDGTEVISGYYYIKITEVWPRHEGLYVCTYGTNHGQLKYHLIVTETTETVFVKSGERAKFGKTVPDDDASNNAEWQRNGQEITSTYSTPTKLNFIIENVSTEDEGLYVCTFGPNKAMQLKYHLIVIEQDETILAVNGDKIVFGKSLPDGYSRTAEWTKNGKDIKSTHSKPTQFQIEKVSSGHEGEYVCTFGSEKMQLKYRLIVADQRKLHDSKDMSEKDTGSACEVTTLIIRSPGKDIMSGKWNIDIGRNGLTLRSEKTAENANQFVYENEKYKEDKYLHIKTEVFLKKPEDVYIVIKMLKKIS